MNSKLNCVISHFSLKKKNMQYLTSFCFKKKNISDPLERNFRTYIWQWFSYFAMIPTLLSFGDSNVWDCLIITMSVFWQKTCRVSELDVNEKGDDDRLVQNGDPFLYGDTIYTCVDGRWLNRGMCSHTCMLCWMVYCYVLSITNITWLHYLTMKFFLL